ncbi:MAG: hypothetical protein JNM36_06415, partial [Chitinophagales bacterium]|nr:hypothetical protein [Chitinophagales bacterium]
METPKSRNSHLAQFCCALKIDNSLYPQFPIGNVTDEVNSIMGNTHMEWTPYGKISQVTHPGGNPNNLPNLAFAYDATQNRVRQDQGYPNNLGGGISKSTFYVRDAQGNPMAIYEQTNDNSIELKEMPLYGSSRLGSISTDVLISNNAINGNVSSSLTFTPDQILHTENNYLLFGLMDVTLANQPLELLATVNQPSPVFQPYPQNTVTNYTSSTTPNYQNTALAEDVQGNMTIGQTVNTLLSNNSPMCFDKNQLMVSNSSQIGAGLNISSQSIIMPIIPTSDGSNPTCYVVFSIKDNHLFAYKLCYDLLGQASFIWQKQLTTGTAIPPLQNTFALSADFTSTDGKIDLYLRRTTSNSNTQIIRLRYPNNAFNSDGTGIPLWESSQAIGTAFTFSPTDPFSATTPEIQISPNGKQLAVANNAGDPEAQTLRGVVRLYRLDISNLATQTATIARLPYTTASPYNKTCIRSIDYSPDGNYLYAIFRKNGTEEVRRAFLSPPAGTDIIFQPLIPTAPIQNILNSPGSQFTSTVRRGKNQRMYVAFRTKPYIYSISEPDNTTLTVADNIHINIAYTYPIETPSLATLRGNINAQAHLQYLRNPKMLPLLATQERGQKQYELTDHLGNVRTTFSDIKQAKATDTPKLDTYTAQGN